MKLDPTRYVRARLVDAAHRLPWGMRLFGTNAEDPGHELVDLWDSHVSMLLTGGSIVRAPAEAAPADPPIEAAPAEPLAETAPEEDPSV